MQKIRLSRANKLVRDMDGQHEVPPADSDSSCFLHRCCIRLGRCSGRGGVGWCYRAYHRDDTMSNEPETSWFDDRTRILTRTKKPTDIVSTAKWTIWVARFTFLICEPWRVAAKPHQLEWRQVSNFCLAGAQNTHRLQDSSFPNCQH